MKAKDFAKEVAKAADTVYLKGNVLRCNIYHQAARVCVEKNVEYRAGNAEYPYWIITPSGKDIRGLLEAEKLMMVKRGGELIITDGGKVNLIAYLATPFDYGEVTRYLGEVDLTAWSKIKNKLGAPNHMAAQFIYLHNGRAYGTDGYGLYVKETPMASGLDVDVPLILAGTKAEIYTTDEENGYAAVVEGGFTVEWVLKNVKPLSHFIPQFCSLQDREIVPEVELDYQTIVELAKGYTTSTRSITWHTDGKLTTRGEVIAESKPLPYPLRLDARKLRIFTALDGKRRGTLHIIPLAGYSWIDRRKKVYITIITNDNATVYGLLMPMEVL